MDAGERHVTVALGSNHRAGTTMPLALHHLDRLLKGFHHTRMLSTDALGDKPGPFVNCMAAGATTLDTGALVDALKAIERRCGDRRQLRNKGKVVMDIDLMEYDGSRHHETDWQRPYIKTLYEEL